MEQADHLLCNVEDFRVVKKNAVFSCIEKTALLFVDKL